jgi:nicotinamidase/pyrazinamidase
VAPALCGRHARRRVAPEPAPAPGDGGRLQGSAGAAYSGFEGRDEAGRELASRLRQAGVDAVDVAGIATTYCVRATALDAVRVGFATRVLTNLVADVDPAATPATWAELRDAGVALEPWPAVRPGEGALKP